MRSPRDRLPVGQQPPWLWNRLEKVAASLGLTQRGKDAGPGVGVGSARRLGAVLREIHFRVFTQRLCVCERVCVCMWCACAREGARLAGRDGEGPSPGPT